MRDFETPISRKIWDDKYRLKDRDGVPVDQSVSDTWMRVAQALAVPEIPPSRAAWAKTFYDIMDEGYFIPAGRIIAGAGSGRKVTLSNCYVMGTVPDSMKGIFEHLREAALTMQAGGGIGYDFSTLRPKDSPVLGVAADASGPLTFMDVWDSMCRTVMSAGQRRGAMMATMRCDHPDIEAFIEAKRDPLRLRMFNVSILVTDSFMKAVKADGEWDLCHEVAPGVAPNTTWATVHEAKEPIRFVYRTIRARDLWDKIMRSTYDYAEPGVIFIDRANADHNLGYREKIATTNPCAEKPMGPYSSCLLGSINLAKFVSTPFTDVAAFDEVKLTEVVSVAVRMMDNVVDANFYPLPQQAERAQQDRQLGLGVTGLADALLLLGMRYGSQEAIDWTEQIMKAVCLSAYRASINLAREKGAFPSFVADEFLRSPRFAGRMLPQMMQDSIRTCGIRNALLVSIAPTGTISLFAGNVSSGIEPVFAYAYTRKVLEADGSRREERVVDYAVAKYESIFGKSSPKPAWFVTTDDLTPTEHVHMMAAAQKWVDSSISKTVNLPEDISFEDFKAVYQMAYDTGCKGCTTYRPNAVTGSVLTSDDKPPVSNGGPVLDVPSPSPSGGGEAGLGDDTDRPGLGYGDPTRGLSGVAARDDTVWRSIFDVAEAEFARVAKIRQSELTAPVPRDHVLSGRTYKIKFGNDNHATYITINDIVETDSSRPFEIFINSKNMQHYAWTVALTRMVSAVFRRGGDVSFVVEELKAVFDPAGGGFHQGQFVPSVVAAIGGVIGRHMEDTGYTVGGRIAAPERPVSVSPIMTAPYGQGPRQDAAERSVEAPVGISPPVFCPKCFSTNLKHEAGCLSCLDCGYSKCG